MWIYEKKLEYPAKICGTNPKLAKAVITQYGGPDGELGASLRYLTQRYTMPTGRSKAILNDIGQGRFRAFSAGSEPLPTGPLPEVLAQLAGGTADVVAGLAQRTGGPADRAGQPLGAEDHQTHDHQQEHLAPPDVGEHGVSCPVRDSPSARPCGRRASPRSARPARS